MKKIALIYFLLLLNLIFSFSLDFKDLSNDAVVMKVGQFEVTIADMKLYMSGYRSIKKWDRYGVELILNKMIFNLLYMNACLDEKLFITDVEMDYYTKRFFEERSVNPKNFDEIQIYFSQNEPYSCIEDFFIKSSFYLNKIKYLAYKGYLKQVKTKNIFFETGKSDKTKKQKIKDEADFYTRQILQGVSFDNILLKYKTKETLSIIEENDKIKKIIGEKNIDRILKAGLFSPIFVEGKDGFYIFLNYEYVFQENEKLVSEITDELAKKYEVTKLITFYEN